jgi:DNA-binding NarL/FixJ family response regulator
VIRSLQQISDFPELPSAISVEKKVRTVCQALADSTFAKLANVRLPPAQTDLLELASPVKNGAPARAGKEPCRAVVVGGTCVSEQGMAAILGRDKRYQVCGSAHGFFDAAELIRKHKPDVLLIEPFLEDRDGIRWIQDLATEFPHTRILIVSRQSERIYAERALHAGAAGYWMKNGSAAELLRAVETVARGEIYISPLITSLAVQKFARRTDLPHRVDALSDRELSVFALIAAEHRPGEIAKELGISRKTVETHFEHIKLKLEYPDAEALKRGARGLLGTAAGSRPRP